MNGSATGGKRQRGCIPAAGYHWLLPLFDLVTKPTGADQARSALLDQADLRPGQRALDVGCGTGTLAILLKKQHPEIEVVGLDPDPKALALARRKARRAGVSTRFEQGFSDELEYPEDSFDHVFSSFMFHHLKSDQKEDTLREIRRVLKPGGYLHLLDFRGPDTGDTRSVTRWWHSHSILKDNAESRVLARMAKAGLADARTLRRFFISPPQQHIGFDFPSTESLMTCISALRWRFRQRNTCPIRKIMDGLLRQCTGNGTRFSGQREFARFPDQIARPSLGGDRIRGPTRRSQRGGP